MAQDINNMMFCNQCKMNVFPSRPKFNIKVFGIFAVLMLIVVIIITFIVSTLFAELFLFIFYMWGFMLFNPYLIYYGLRKKNNCPRCYENVVEKNLSYKPFGEKEPEIYKEIKKNSRTLVKWYCPYCGTPAEGNFCKKCGKKLELKI